MKSKEVVNINVRIPKTLKHAIEEHVQRGVHINFSGFVRDALRNKITNEAPWLFEEVLKTKGDSGLPVRHPKGPEPQTPREETESELTTEREE